MTREEVIANVEAKIKRIKHIMDEGDYGCVDIENWEHWAKQLEYQEIILAALRGWVKTSDRLPKSRDENGFGVIVAYNPELGNKHDHGYAACIRAWCVDPQSWPYWMPLPKLPEVDG